MQLGTFQSTFAVMLAPMAGVTDLPFRLLCKRHGCDITFTEMISAKGLNYHNAKTQALLDTAPEEWPVGVQLFGSEPAALADAARRIQDSQQEKLLLIDINMGCPAPKITTHGEGCALMRDLPLAGRIIEATARALDVPVTVKFRKGWDEASVNAPAFARMAEQSGAAAITIHGRTREQFYSGKADWDCIADVKAAVSIPVFGNGDVFHAADALRMRAHTRCDGILIARGAQGNPFLFSQIRAALRGEPILYPSDRERADMALTHARMQQAYKGAHGIIQMRKHVAWYIKGMPGAARLRTKVNACTSLEALEEILFAIE